jgi:hypothetical protein
MGFEETGVNLIVFIDPAGESSYLLKIARNSETRVKTYQELNSADAMQMKQVQDDIIGMSPADSYSLALCRTAHHGCLSADG